MLTTTKVDKKIPWINERKIDEKLWVVWSGWWKIFTTQWTWLLWSELNFVECPFPPSSLIIQWSYVNTTDSDFWFEAKIQKWWENICYFNDADFELLNSTTSNSIEVGTDKKTVWQIEFKTNWIEVDLQPNAYFDIKWTITFF